MLDLLRHAADAGRRSGHAAVPPGILGFTLEYDAPPDTAVERERIETLLGGTGFDLFPLSEDDPDLLILSFPDFSAEQSPDFLFAEAQDLRDALNLRAVTPEIGPQWTDIAAARPMTEGFGDILWALCASKAASPGDPDWARKLIRADRAARRFGVSGKGIIIAQPDTGVADHLELRQGLDRARGFDFVDNRPDPVDPLSAKMKSPGHGTATSSLVISRTSNTVTGTAFGATLAPMRAVNSVIIGAGNAVALAVDRAWKQDCHIVSMSLGGPVPGTALRRAIDRAVARGLIVVVAAGNCVGVVTFPAWHGNAIAVAGVDRNGARWKGSSRGQAVAFAAPAENVHVARRLPLTPGTTPDLGMIDRRGQGTSYATALTAGVAALWLERFGIAAVRAEARRRGSTVQALFRAAVQASADTPRGWDTANMGAGIINAERLLDLQLNAIPGGGATESVPPQVAAFGRDFSGSGLEAEAAFVAFDWAMRAEDSAAPAIETAMPARPSPQLAAAIGDRAGPPVRTAPAIIATPATPPVPLDDALKRLAVGRTGTLESAAEISHDDAMRRLKADGPNAVLDTVRDVFAARAESAPGLVDKGLQAEALGRMERALGALTDETRDHGISGEETRVVLEALVKLTGRPAIRVRGDGSEVFDPQLGEWRADLVPTRNRWQPLTAATGRIDVRTAQGWVHSGTGFHVSPGFIMTNRHVLDTFAEPLPTAAGARPMFLLRREASIIFDPEAEDDAMRFAITGVETAGKSRIGRVVDLGNLDMAVLRIETSQNGTDAPDAIDRTTVSVTDTEIRRILLTGYPAKPSSATGPSASDQSKFLEFWDRIGELYGDEYGKQYMSPGQVMLRPGHVPGDPKGWIFTHDATTMPGNSGSAVISLQQPTQFCGLHFGGETLTQNLAHDIQTVFAGGDGVFSTDFLGAGGA